MPLADLVPTLQTAIGPMILVSGVGLILLTMTNRLGRIIDRTRSLARERRERRSADLSRLDAQLAILARRARLVRAAIALAATSVLLAALLVITLFLAALLDKSPAWTIAALFGAGMAALVASLLLFLKDVDLSLSALALEVAARPPVDD